MLQYETLLSHISFFRVKSIPKADSGIGMRVSQIVLKKSGNTVSKITRPVWLNSRLGIGQ